MIRERQEREAIFASGVAPRPKEGKKRIEEGLVACLLGAIVERKKKRVQMHTSNARASVPGDAWALPTTSLA